MVTGCYQSEGKVGGRGGGGFCSKDDSIMQHRQPPSEQRHVSSAVWLKALGGRQHAVSRHGQRRAWRRMFGERMFGEACVDVLVSAADVGRLLQLRCDNR